MLRLHLIDAGQLVSDSDFLSLFMGTLPEEYDILSTTISYDLDTIEDVVNKLHQIEIQKEVCPRFSEGSAFVMQRVSGGSWTLQHGYRGHRGQRGSNSAGWGSSSRGWCYECNEVGHWARNCPKRSNTSQHSSQQQE
jgi:hypothetical protein